jgi:hypothetical protein
MTGRSAESHPAYLKPTSLEHQLLKLFIYNPDRLLTQREINREKFWKGTPPNGNLANMVSNLRADLPEPAGIISIFGESGYVYYPRVKPFMEIHPEGFRPNPIVPVATTVSLHTLFDAVSHATVRENLAQADAVIPSMRYTLLIMLANARQLHMGVSAAEIGKKFHNQGDALRMLRYLLKSDLDELTEGLWHLVHPWMNEPVPEAADISYLTNIRQPMRFIVPNGQPRPGSPVINNTLIL